MRDGQTNRHIVISIALLISPVELKPNKLYQIKDNICEFANAFRNKRRDKAILARRRIGYTYITHSYMLKREDKPWCV